MMNIKLRNIREHKKKSQADLGSLLGISQPQYQRKEVGYSSFSDEEYDLLAEYLNVPKSDLIDDKISQNNFKQKGGISTIYYIADKLADEVIDLNLILKTELIEIRKENQQLNSLIIEMKNTIDELKNK